MCSVYVVTAYKFGSREQHSYVVGVFTNLDRAIAIAKEVPKDRTRKYFAEVLKFQLDKIDNAEFDTILPLSRYQNIGNIIGTVS